MNQCWNIVNSNLRSKLQWNLKRNSCIFIQENVFENLVCEFASILSRPQCVNTANPRTIRVDILRVSYSQLGRKQTWQSRFCSTANVQHIFIKRIKYTTALISNITITIRYLINMLWIIIIVWLYGTYIHFYNDYHHKSMSMILWGWGAILNNV